MDDNRSDGIQVDDFNPFHITRPDERLFKYYILVSLLSGPFFPLALIPLAFKYVTLRYRFDDSGIGMSWGVIFRREVFLTYRRIQDIHLSRNIVQRWMGLATVGVQTASGSASPEMNIEGILEVDELRDFLYRRMRGAHGDPEAPVKSHEGDDVLVLLHEIRDLLRGLPAQRSPGP